MGAEAELTQSTPLIDSTTVLSLLATLVLLLASYALSLRVLPKGTTGKLRFLFVWHLFDALIHFLFEGSFLYNCFFIYAEGVPNPNPNNFLDQPHRAYGAIYGSGVTAKLWQEYAKADSRWGGTDLTIISLELLTVVGAGPLAAWIVELIRRGKPDGKLWFACVVLATGELYGGWMTFCPEWLSGSRYLDTSNFLYLWVYLFFFNTLWVWIPLWILYESYVEISRAFETCYATPDAQKGSLKKDR